MPRTMPRLRARVTVLMYDGTDVGPGYVSEPLPFLVFEPDSIIFVPLLGGGTESLHDCVIAQSSANMSP